MALHPDDERPIEEDDVGQLADVLAELAAACSGWVNLVPEVASEHEPPPRNLVIAVFSSRGDPVPLATWTAPARPGGRPTIGITHGSGPRALDRLADGGLTLPEGWWKAADHPRRGLVVNPSADARHEDVLTWLVTAAHALSTVPLTGSWQARIYRPTAGR